MELESDGHLLVIESPICNHSKPYAQRLWIPYLAGGMPYTHVLL